MGDSQHGSASSCWATFTNFSSSQKGILLYTEIIFCLLILTCFCDLELGYYSLMGIEMNLAVVFLVLYLTGLHTKIQCISWPWCDFFRTLSAAIIYLITSISVLAGKGTRSEIIDGILGLIATCLFGCDAYVSSPLRQ
ncbi:proteolipid protein 2-like [Phyllostomus hastatus]|uniref:proteolipid protein 2-like n=1 Tax=Phyllostomus hastatus TaxID=9423 RepID=UPI001E684F9E|nr:proteolipid protein 2-like [Phyllostomus hastatus]